MRLISADVTDEQLCATGHRRTGSLSARVSGSLSGRGRGVANRNQQAHFTLPQRRDVRLDDVQSVRCVVQSQTISLGHGVVSGGRHAIPRTAAARSCATRPSSRPNGCCSGSSNGGTNRVGRVYDIAFDPRSVPQNG